MRKKGDGKGKRGKGEKGKKRWQEWKSKECGLSFVASALRWENGK